MDKIARKIKRARVEAGLSQREIADTLKLSDRTISAYEKGRAMPPLDTLQGIGSLTHKPINYFLDEDIDEDENIELQMKLKRIELELLNIKRVLKEHNLWD